MTRNQRRIYTLFFFFLFAITAPTLIFLAKGYSFDTISGVFVHNGAITIKSIPKKVDLYLDGKKISNKMLNIINNYYVINGIRFGKYTIECRKDGYTSWKKKVDIHSGVSTEFWNILLFPTENKTLKVYDPQNIKQFYLSPRQEDELVLYKKEKTTKTISTFTAKDGQENIIYSTDDYDDLVPNSDENIEWSSNYKKLLIPAEKNNQKDYIIVDIGNNAEPNLSLLNILSKVILLPLKTAEYTTPPTSLNEHVSEQKVNPATVKKPSLSLSDTSIPSANIPEIHQARWMFDSNHQILLLTKKHELFFINTKDTTKSILLAQNVNGFDLAGDHVYYSKLTENLIWDIKPNKPSYKQPVSIINLEVDVDSFVKLFAYDELRIALITSNNKLYLLNNSKPNNKILFSAIEDDVVNIQFSDDGKKMLYWTKNSFWVYMLREWDAQPRREKGEKIFITRFSSGVKNVQWMETFENILFTNNSLVKSAELDNRDQINLVDVLKLNTSFPEKNTHIYNKDTGILYFLDTTKEDPTLKVQSVELVKYMGFFGFN